MLTTILSFVFVLGLLIFVHELGHFVTAKMVGIRVERFSLGFPPRMIGKKIGDTDYCISWLPLGGYVKMAGMVDETLEANIKGEPWEFQSKSIWQRVLVISAGSLMNLITAVVIFALVAYFNGIPKPQGAQISEVLEGKPAASIGLKPGDVIVAVGQQPVSNAEELTRIIHKHPEEEIELTWKREGETFTARVVPEREPENNIGLIGIRVGTKMQYENAGFFQACSYGLGTTVNLIKLIGQSLKMIVTGEERLRDALGGPIIIAKMAGESAKMGWQNLLQFTAFISLNLGLLNIMPVPVLDGGHLVFLLIEAIRRKPLSIKTRLVVQKIGMALLLALMVFIIFNDIRRIL